MSLVNTYEIDSPYGSRYFELHLGDITRLALPTDILCISAFSGSYKPVAGTVIGALHSNHAISVEELSLQPELDLRQVFGCWVSRPLKGAPFERLLVVEMVGRFEFVDDAIENVFAFLAVLEAKNYAPRRIALPILGTGEQKQDMEAVMASMLRHAPRFLRRSESIEELLLVAYREDQADRLGAAMNRILQRDSIILPHTDLVRALKKDILEQARRASRIHPQQTIFHILSGLMEADEARSYELGIAARRLTEFIVQDISGPNSRGFDLANQIEHLRPLGIADWIRSYMHVLRVFGNEAAHEKDMTARMPAALDESDLGLCLFCIHRLFEFWLQSQEYEHGQQKFGHKMPGS